MHGRAKRWPETVLLAGLVIIVIGLCGIAPPAMAQEKQPAEQQPPAAQAPAAPPNQPQLTPEEQADMEKAMKKAYSEEIVVTGSLIPRPTLESMSPVSVMTPEELTYSGVTRVEDLVRQLPQVFSGQNSTISNGASGTATVDLRNMGSQRTLVLINGRRMAPGDATSGTAAITTDLNFIPAFLVKRVDVLTGGASSVYGADAVTGVVNFVLDTDFEGVRGGISWAGYQHDNSNKMAQAMNEAAGFNPPKGSVLDGDQWNVNVAVGGKFAGDKGHGVLYIDYRNIDALTKDQRDYTNCAVGRGDTGPVCTGSGTIPAGRFLVFDPNWNQVGDYVLDRTTGNTLRDTTGSDVFNFGPYNYMQRPDKKYAAGGFADYKINKHFDVYGEVMFMDDYSRAQIAPSGDFGNTSRINCDNPMLSPQQRDLLCTQPGFGPTDYANVIILRRSVETGPRTSLIRHTSWRLVSGLRGDINDSWSYDVYGLYGEMSSPQEYVGDLSINRMQDALDVVGDPADPSTWACRSGNPGCVPWNVFQTGGVTPEAARYISLNMDLLSGAKTQMVNGTVHGDLGSWGVKFPSATEAIKVAFGTEFRDESLFVHPDDNWGSGNGAGQGGPTSTINGRYGVREYFLEGLVPIIQDAPLAKDLSLELGYRYSDYSTSGGFPTWKAQGSWSPSGMFKLRVGLAKATRAPNIREMFLPQGLSLNGSEDPCANDPVTGVPSLSLEQCLRTGMTAEQYGHVITNPAAQYNTLSGGNPSLDPESADTKTAGIVFTPPSIAGFSLAVDYYDIKIDKTINTYDPDALLTACALTGAPELCSLIHRDVTGSLWLTTQGYTITTFLNIGKMYGRGVDLNYDWSASLGGSGYLHTSLIGSYMLKNRFSTPLLDYDCVGYYGDKCSPYPSPKWRHTARISWETNFNTVFTLGWRFINSVTIDAASPNPALNNPDLAESWRINGAYTNPRFNYFDLAFTYNFAEHYQLVAGCQNITDKEPPLAPGLTDNDYGTGFYGFYDPYGRTLHAAMHFDF